MDDPIAEVMALTDGLLLAQHIGRAPPHDQVIDSEGSHPQMARAKSQATRTSSAVSAT